MDFIIYFLFIMAILITIVDTLGLWMVFWKKDNIFSQIILARCNDESGLKLRGIKTILSILMLAVAVYFYREDAKIYALVILILVHGLNSLFERVLSELI